MKFESRITIHASPQRIWQVLEDVERWPMWANSFQSIVRLADDPLGVGAQVRIKQPRLPAGIWTITDWVPEQGFTWVTRGVGFMAKADHFITACGSHQVFSQQLLFEGMVGVAIAAVSRKRTERYLAVEAAGLKLQSERAESSAASQEAQ